MGLFSKIGNALGISADSVFGGATGIVSGLFGSRQAKRQMQFQAGQTAQQMQFQERMARHAHQYEVEDLLAAGLNPILSGTGGSGATAMPGASGSGAMTGIDPMTSALSAKRLTQEIKNLKAAESKLNAETVGVNLENLGRRKLQSDMFNAINPWSIKSRYDETHPSSAKGYARVKRAQMVPNLDKMFKRTQKYKESVDTDIAP